MKARRIYVFVILFMIALLNNHFSLAQTENAFSERIPENRIKEWNNLFIQLNLAKSNKDYSSAILICENVLAIDKYEGEITYAKTLRYFEKDDEAIIWAKKAVQTGKELNQSIETPLLIIASCNLLKGDYPNATKTLDEIIALYPNSPMGYKFYAQYYEKIDDKKNAIKYWQEALKRFTDERAIQQAKERIAALEKSK